MVGGQVTQAWKVLSIIQRPSKSVTSKGEFSTFILKTNGQGEAGVTRKVPERPANKEV